jgi:hypothetical protein
MSYCKYEGCSIDSNYRNFCDMHQARIIKDRAQADLLAMVVDRKKMRRKFGCLFWVYELFVPPKPEPQVSAYSFKCGACAKSKIQGTRPETISIIAPVGAGEVSEPICGECLNMLVKGAVTDGQ